MMASPNLENRVETINPFDSSKSEERFELLARLRRESPILKLDSGQYFITSQAGVETVLKNVDHFVGSFGDTEGATEDTSVLAAIPEPRHGKIRKIFNSALAYHHASKVEPFVIHLAAELLEQTLDAAKRDGEVEIMNSYVRPIPSAVIAHVLGVPQQDFERFARWSDEVLKRQTSDDSANKPLATLHMEFHDYLQAEIELRTSSEAPPDDFITRMLTTEIDGTRLSEQAVLTQTMFLILAGNETTRNLIGNIVERLARYPELFAQVRAEPELIPTLVEEILRFDSPVQLLARTCTRPIEVEGVQLEVGERVLLSIASANRDETSLEDASNFRLDRKKPRDNVALGAGPHICPGAFLARMESKVALDTFIERVAAVGIAPSHVENPNPVFWANGPGTLQLVLTPA
jgi:cytochrome P450